MSWKLRLVLLACIVSLVAVIGGNAVSGGCMRKCSVDVPSAPSGGGGIAGGKAR